MRLVQITCRKLEMRHMPQFASVPLALYPSPTPREQGCDSASLALLSLSRVLPRCIFGFKREMSEKEYPERC